MLRAYRERLTTALVALLAGVGGVAGSYSVVGFTPELIVAPVARVFTDVLPARRLGRRAAQFGVSGQDLNLLLATGVTVVGLAVIAAVGIAAGRRGGTAAFAVTTTGALSWAVAAVLTDAPIAAAGVGLGCAMVVGLAEAAGRDIEQIEMAPDRRRIIAGSAAALGLGSLGLGTNGIVGPPRIESEPVDAVTNPGGTVEDEGVRPVEDLRQLASERTFDVGSVEPLVSKNHYNVDINSIDPAIDRDSWTLSVTGDVEEEIELGFDDLRQLPADNRIVTLQCVGDSLNGKKIDTAIWTGVPVSAILEQASPSTDCDCVMLRADDGFYEEFPLSALEDGLLAYGMNGQTLPRSHGYPLRALVPGHWGEVNVKWLTEIEILESEQEGYWEEKGWHGTGPVNTVTKLWDGGIVHRDDGTIALVGHAYAGTRGIERVEVSIDGGDSWTDATLTEPLPGDDVWRQWTHTYDPPEGKHEVVVRAVDGNGDLQPEEESGPYPRGASGWVSQTVRP